MPKVLISDEVYKALEQVAILPFKETGVQVAPGWNEVPVEEDTMESLNLFREDGETDESALRRLLKLPLQKLT